MSKKRTLKEKLQAQELRRRKTEVLPESSPANQYTFEFADSGSAGKIVQPLLKIDKKYIAQDLFKTVLISGILFTLLIGIYFYLGYN